jgi:hypothetical protein
VSLSAGAFQFDASGTGWAPVVALRGEHALVGRWLLGEAGVGYAPIGEQFAADRTHLGLAEVQLQLQAPFARVRPYVGGGGGLVSYLRGAGGRDVVTSTLSVAGGVRAALSNQFGLRAELRVRGWDDFVNSAAEYTVGLSRSF